MTGEQIREARKRKGLTQRELAEAVGTTQSVISEIESGARLPNLASIERIAGALGMTARLSLVEKVSEAAPAAVAG